MPSNVLNRTTVRRALATLLDTALVGSGKPAEALYRYMVSDFQGKSPVIVVSSAPTNRNKQAQVTRVHSFVDLDIDNYVLYSAEGWTEEQSEDALDELEKAVSDVLMDNDTTETWAQLSFKGDSDLDYVAVGGKMYRVETIHVRTQLYSE